MNRAGCAWHLLPHDFPPYRTVCDHYAKREKDGTTEAIHDLLRARVREKAGRSAEPTAAIIDARVVTTSSNVPEASQGYDAGKRTKGRKRHIAADTLGLLLAVVITAASVQDTSGGQDAADKGIIFDVVRKEPDQKGFTPLPRRWASSAPSAGSSCTGGLSVTSRPSRNVPPR